ncbi:ssDNA endonuclease and repair protein rad10 [Aspergillus tubingensis]|uniref:Mating-type switching protein Swi10 n=2 Tax=Aspergillus subgen. Circumdati TaxID=2720871 RepID=A0A100IAY5_ASPNG|nr:mating-type switching protein Swi10 [Aspergillus tubingensis]GAQ37271.1 mating-type switching protein Swi10 [Aspergillus niger]GFN12796.1 mating-type switching protein Swi10 [Aspergillus tubingensis]GLA70556.1 ssDNA endonuclease and repair protein rad10 [Aspergillus tubingensis]GLA82529.1 ssDNA endonuclease and repair protein rad10 [Aspergillus tubingensis]GLB00891.1 ssDNA endonuclease and repair protein rad10 [Aspergillus tubingensis]
MDPVARSESATPRASGASTPQPSSKVQQPKPQALPSRSGPSAILVSTRQKGNPILNHIKLLPWEYADIPADYVVGSTTCALFLSLKYHRLHPEYIYSRIRLIAGKYLLRIILVIVDIPNHEESLKELSKTSIVNNMTLILCWSAPEAAHYLELFKSSENSQPTAIRTQQAQSYKESLVEFVTTPRSINKSDAASLISTFGSLQNAVNAQPEQISAVPGWGEKKVKQWCSTVREGFRVESAKRKTRGGIAGSHATGVVEGQEDKPFNPSESNEDTAAETILADAEDGRLEARRQVVEDRRMQESSQQEEGMSEGIMAALAKYREDGG